MGNLRRLPRRELLWASLLLSAVLTACSSAQSVEPAPVIPALDPGDGSAPTAAPTASPLAPAAAAPRRTGVPEPDQVATDTGPLRSALPSPRGTDSAAPAAVPAAQTGPTRAAGPAPATVEAVARTDAPLPAPGRYDYTLTGESTLGALPTTMQIRVTGGRGGAQHWVLDASAPPGRVGSLEDLGLQPDPAGLSLNSDDLTINSAVAAFELHFRPPQPVLLLPAPDAAARGWTFEITSTDGCARARTTGSVVHDPKAAPLQHIRLITLLASTGRAGCRELNARRTEDIWHAADSLLPTRLDTDVAGKVQGTPVNEDSRAELRGRP